MIEAVFLEIEVRQSFLNIRSSEIVVSGYRGLWCSVQVDPDESRSVDPYMYAEKGVFGFVEPCNVLVLRCLR